MVIHPLFEDARVLMLVVLLGLSVASAAQSTDSAPDADSESVDSWTSDLKAPLRPADNVGGSWNWVLLYGRMADEQLSKVFVFNTGWEEARLLSGEIGYTLKEDNPVVRFLDPVLSTVDVVKGLGGVTGGEGD